MKVNTKNYEVWIIDYFDGKLNASETAELMTFLDLHPELKEDFELFDPTPVDTEKVYFPNKADLKKVPVIVSAKINEENYEEYFIAFYENDLDESEDKNLQAFLAINPQLKEEFELHGSLLLQADKTIVYEQKDNLHKKRRVAVYWWSGTAAAMIVILFGILNLLQNSDQTPNRNLETFTISNLELQEFNSLGIADKIDMEFTSRPTPKSNITESDLVPEFPIEKFELTSLVAVNKKIILTKTEQHPTFIQPEYDRSEIIYALAENSSETRKKKNLLGKIIKNFASRATENTPDVFEKPNKKDPTFLKVLDQSIMVFNTITGSDTELTKSYDDAGNLRRYQVDGQSLSWGKDISASPPNGE